MFRTGYSGPQNKYCYLPSPLLICTGKLGCAELCIIYFAGHKLESQTAVRPYTTTFLEHKRLIPAGVKFSRILLLFSQSQVIEACAHDFSLVFEGMHEAVS